jgi:hypothetical protein
VRPEGPSALSSRTVRRLAGGLGCLVALGCGGGATTQNTTGDGGAWQPTSDQQAFMSQFCDAIRPCCEEGGTPADAGTNCRATLLRSGVSADPSLRAACLAEVQQLAGESDCVPDVANLADPCVRTFNEPSGPRAAGQPCAHNADCTGSAATSTICAVAPTPTNLSAPPICVVRAVGRDGDHPCLGTLFADGVTIDYGVVLDGSDVPLTHGVLCDRGSGLYCDPSTRVCMPLLSGSTPCTFADACASRVCRSDGTCSAVVSAGQACMPAVCDDANTCDPASLVCTSKLARGAACTDSAQCMGSCVQGTCSPITRAQKLVLAGWCG